MSLGTRSFHAGPLSFRLGLENGHLRDLRWHGHEVLRGIYPAVRDPGWATLAPVAVPADTTEEPGRVAIKLRARVRTAGGDLEWTASIVAEAGGRLRYDWRAHAAGAFETNRTGLCVLHPAEAAGLPCTIEHADGQTIAGWFPTTISPHQPFESIRAIAHPFAAGAEAVVRFEGEVFEMEDQRNWTDASFKTYCRPLALPRPYRVAAGERIEQSVTITVAGTPTMPAKTTGPLALRTSPGPLAPLPRIGFGLTAPLPAGLRTRARALRPAHVRVETGAEDLVKTVEWAREEAAALDCALELAVRAATEPPRLMPDLRAEDTLMLFDAAGNTVDAATLARWAERTPASLGTGTQNHFTDLNRARPAAAGAHRWIGFAMNAQVHAFDDESMLETVSQHGVLARHAAAIAAGHAVAVSPLVLGPSAEHDDPRLASTLGALWTLASLSELTRADVARATYFRLHGPGGMLRTAEPTPLELLFGSLAGATHVQPVTFDAVLHPSPVHPLLVTNGGVGRRLFLAHLGAQPIEINVPLSGESTVLGAARPGRFAGGPLQLAPHSVWQLELS